MSEQVPQWLAAGKGERPRQRWAFTVDAPLTDLKLSRETTEILAADESGGLYRFDRQGRICTLSRGFHGLTSLAFSDTGEAGAAVLGEDTVCRLNARFDVQWSLKMHEPITALGITPYGHHIGVSLANGNNLILEASKKRRTRFETERPLCFLQFLTEAPALLGAAEYGLICRHTLEGNEVWSEKLWSSVGDLSVTGDGNTMFIAGFSHGIQAFAHDGTNTGAYMVEGTPNHVAASYVPKRIAATTLERQLYWLASDGKLLWATHLPEDICRILCGPGGEWIVCGFHTGRIVFLEW